MQSPPTGGMAGFVLAVFHWFEMKHKGPYNYFLSLIKYLSKRRTGTKEEADSGENAQRRTVDVSVTRTFIYACVDSCILAFSNQEDRDDVNDTPKTWVACQAPEFD